MSDASHLASPHAVVTAVSSDATHRFSKPNCAEIELLAGLGVAGDAHSGATVQHRSRVAKDPSRPNLRQVHLIGAELHEALASAGFSVAPGALGENVTTHGVNLLDLPVGARLSLGETAVVDVTGLRNPCAQINKFQPGLLSQVLGRDAHGEVVRTAGVMAVVTTSGIVRPHDLVGVTLPKPPHRPLAPV